MNNFSSIIGKTVLGVCAAAFVFMSGMVVYDRVSLSKEEELMKDHIGQMVTVDDHEMCIYSEGKGDHTLVFMAPSGEDSPIYSFKPLTDRLKKDYRVVVIEKFGYGFSDSVDTERDIETILRQDRQALKEAGIEGPYILCPYSMSGIEALLWAQTEPQEVEAIAGIDMVFPEAFDGYEYSEDLMTKFMVLGRETGVIRLFLGDDAFEDVYNKTLTEDELKIYKALVRRNYLGRDELNEAEHIADAASLVKSNEVPDIPMDMILTNGEGTGKTTEEWQGIAKRYTSSVSDVRYSEIDCSHHEIMNYSQRLADDISNFAAGL